MRSVSSAAAPFGSPAAMRRLLPGFDENPYVEHGEFDRRSPADLLAEFDTVRHSHLFLFENLAR